MKGKCVFMRMLDREADRFTPVPSEAAVAAECNSTAGMLSLYRRFARVVPMRFTGRANASAAASKALKSYLAGSNRKAPK